MSLIPNCTISRTRKGSQNQSEEAKRARKRVSEEVKVEFQISPAKIVETGGNDGLGGGGGPENEEIQHSEISRPMLKKEGQNCPTGHSGEWAVSVLPPNSHCTFAAICEHTTTTKHYPRESIASRLLKRKSHFLKAPLLENTLLHFETEKVSTLPNSTRISRLPYCKDKPTMSTSSNCEVQNQFEFLKFSFKSLSESVNFVREEEDRIRHEEDQVREEEDKYRRKQNERRRLEYLRREEEDDRRLREDTKLEKIESQLKALGDYGIENERSKRRRLPCVFVGKPDINDLVPLAFEMNRLFSPKFHSQQQISLFSTHLDRIPLTIEEQELEYLRIPLAKIYAMKFFGSGAGRISLPALVFERDLSSFQRLGHSKVEYVTTDVLQPICLSGKLRSVARKFTFDEEKMQQICCSECPIPVLRNSEDHVKHQICHERIFALLV